MSSEKALREQIKRWLAEENGRERLLEGAIAQKGQEYHREGEPDKKDLVLVGYYKDEEHLDLIKANMLYYVPAALGKGSINLVSGFEKTKYLLLHHKDKRYLVHLKGEGPRFYPRTELEGMGFTPKGEYYLGFDISSFKEVKGIDPYAYELGRKNQGEHTPYFVTLDKIVGKMA